MTIDPFLWVGGACSTGAAGESSAQCMVNGGKVSYKGSATRKTLEVLKLIANTKRQLGVSEIARALSINKSTTFGILRALQEDAYVLKDVSTKKYMVGDELVRLSKMISGEPDVAHVARPFLRRLAEAVDETVFLCVSGGATIKIIDVVEAKKNLMISSAVGTKISITAGAPGKAYLASLPDREVLSMVKEQGLPAWTRTSITDVDRFLREIEATRRQGFALDREEYLTGVRGVATHISVGNRVAGIIWVAGFSGSMDQKKALEVSRKIIETARLVTERLNSGGIRAAREDGDHHSMTPRLLIEKDFRLPMKNTRVFLEQGT